MQCKKCKNEIPENSIFCLYCGTRMAAAPRKSAGEKELKIPKPRQLASGTWFLQLRLDGESVPVTGDTEKECRDKATLIKVRGARVQNDKNVLVEKETNKTHKSTRQVPIMIPRLETLLSTLGEGYIIKLSPNRLTDQIDTVCRHAGLPQVGLQGLRRSFASLAYHLKWDERTTMAVGGWSNVQTVHKYYIKLSAADIAAKTESMKAFYTSENANQDANKNPQAQQ